MTRRTRQVGTIVLTAAADRVPRLEGRARNDARRPRGHEPRVVRARGRRSWSLTVPVLALRWGWLLDAHDIHERVPWLTRAVLRRVHGGAGPSDRRSAATPCASSRRRAGIPGAATVVTGTVLLERGLGGAATRAPRRDRVPALDRRATTSARTSGSRACSSSARWCSAFLFFARSARPLLASRRAAARAAAARRAAARASTRASTTTAAVRACSGRSFAVTLPCRRCASSPSGLRRRRSASTSIRGSTTSSGPCSSSSCSCRSRSTGSRCARPSS